MAEPANGTEREIDGKPCVYYDGYWIRRYDPPQGTLAAKKHLIDQLTRRLFHHSEPGINTPGTRLDEARLAYEGEQDPAKRRVKGAMLAGALFNRATDILTKLVELQEAGVEIAQDNELLNSCEVCFLEALELGRTVKGRYGEEGIDELWGEPFRAFSMPIEAFYESRYIKIAQTMRQIDEITATLVRTLKSMSSYLRGVDTRFCEFAEAAKAESETLRSDPAIFEVWANFVATRDYPSALQPTLRAPLSETDRKRVKGALDLLREGKELVAQLALVRGPMPKSTQAFVDTCNRFIHKMGDK